MDTKTRCQSCEMPLGEGFFGTNTDHTANQEYCKFCYQNGDFTNPELTLENMIQLSVENMVQELGFDETKARNLAESFIPQLKRWQ